MPQTNADTLTNAQAARLLHVHRNTIRNMIRDGRLPAHPRNRRGWHLLDREVVEMYARGVVVEQI